MGDARVSMRPFASWRFSCGFGCRIPILWLGISHTPMTSHRDVIPRQPSRTAARRRKTREKTKPKKKAGQEKWAAVSARRAGNNPASPAGHRRYQQRRTTQQHNNNSQLPLYEAGRQSTPAAEHPLQLERRCSTGITLQGYRGRRQYHGLSCIYMTSRDTYLLPFG